LDALVKLQLLAKEIGRDMLLKGSSKKEVRDVMAEPHTFLRCVLTRFFGLKI